MQKDQGVGTVVNNLLYLSLGYHMVFKVVRFLSRHAKQGVLRDAKKERLWCIKYKMDDFEVELRCIFKIVINFSFILMCDYNSVPAYSQN